MTPCPTIDGKPDFAFLSNGINARNALSHSAGTNERYDLAHMAKEMRAFSLALISTFNKLPPIALNEPRPHVALRELTFRVR
jgi:hypothetical protein